MASTKSQNTAKRVFVSVSRKSSQYSDAWDCPDKIILKALNLVKTNDLASWEETPATLFLAKERANRIMIVFDIFNDAYDPDKAHLPTHNDLPVIAVYFSGRDGADSENVSCATQGLQGEVNQRIRELHDWNGFGAELPFIVDRSGGRVPTYLHPRFLSKNPPKT